MAASDADEAAVLREITSSYDVARSWNGNEPFLHWD